MEYDSLKGWIDIIKNRLHVLNKNYLLVICGETGNGKSYVAMRLGELIDQNFNKDKIVFRTADLMEYIDKNIDKGDCIVWDESGIDEGANRRNWYSVQNKCINYLFQTIRHENACIIMTVPSLSFIDSGILHLIHGIITTERIDYENELNICKFKQLQHNPEIGKTYRKHIRASNGHETFKYTRMKIGKPQNPELINWYEVEHKKFKREKVTDWKEDIKKNQENKKKEWGKPIEVGNIINGILENPKPYTKKRNKIKYIDWKLIGLDYNIGEQTAKKVKTAIERELFS